MNYQLLSDYELMDLLKASDEKAFEEIYLRHWRGAFLTTYKKTGNKELSEELLQNVFLDLWRKRGAVNIQNLPNYIYSSVRYAVINHIKSQIVQEKYLEYSMTHAEQEEASSDHLVLMRDLADAIEKGISLLPQKTQQVFRLSRFDNHTVREIAQQLKISEKAVEYHITRSLKTMRYYLKDYLLFLILFWIF
ncbi:RNA polymerase sigma-70 factor (ECF subfamily) [Arcticibacter tournemirensis]|uniref:Sigma-70 family RNA polymerase sigma factor n=1 Tax=Arcticibacter tournemirensis TaxID=699437 RepID=A0A5M9H8Q4_9SPHI|nr:sigma-70 family RNA polymerase sigma factor [Arcticibacter tournemirensis]KAA8481558.1 sigma-70 family RNA polymerase sigma factor [Arcticibacter tournemirensis]TQM49054.1 RNA polymerase sigma-70 factor (ECF subfamily) [Arcticibacter tournemirensis]